MPFADKFQLHVYAALAEQERTFISERTKAALQAAKARGVKLGGVRDATMKRNKVRQENAKAHADKMIKLIQPMLDGGASAAGIARTLNEMKIPTPRHATWTPTQIIRIINRANA